MEFRNLLYEIKDGILYLMLNRPEARNALTPEMWRDITTAVKAADQDESVRVIILGSKGGKALASGADIRELHDRYYMEQMRAAATKALKDLEDIYKPVICAVNGYALGGGCELAMACDIRIATKRSKFGQPETGLGFIPGAGGTQRLSRLVGLGKAKELQFGIGYQYSPNLQFLLDWTKRDGKVDKGTVKEYDDKVLRFRTVLNF